MVRFTHKIENRNGEYHCVGHSMLKLCQQQDCEPSREDIRVNWHYRGGARLREIVHSIEHLMQENANKDLKIILHCWQNNMRTLTTDDIDWAFDFVSNLIHRYGGRHRVIFSECDFPPELLQEGFGQKIRTMNEYITKRNRENGFEAPLKPWKVATHMLGNRIQIKPDSWQEGVEWTEQGPRSRGYHISNSRAKQYIDRFRSYFWHNFN